MLRGEATLEGNDAFVQWNGSDGRYTGDFAAGISEARTREVAGLPCRTVVSGDGWKLSLSPGDQGELYDLNSDPFEQRNLFDEAGHRERVRDLASRIRQWQGRTGDDTVLPAV